MFNLAPAEQNMHFCFARLLFRGVFFDFGSKNKQLDKIGVEPTIKFCD
jgi:hypothetical protein